jgi:hypothetical protein
VGWPFHGGVVGRTAVGDHIPVTVLVQRHGGWQMVSQAIDDASQLRVLRWREAAMIMS